MAYNGRVYRILIASPSDVEDERELAVRVIQEWNDLYSYSKQVVLLPLRWETHTAPEYGTRPQEVINRTIVDQCDLLLGIFWTRIGTQTGEADSGTIEEIMRVAEAGKPAMLYFSKTPIDPDKIDLEQVARLKAFKERIAPNALTESYKSIIEFRDKLAKQLELKVRDLQKADTSGQPAPLDLQFLSLESGKLMGNSVEVAVELPQVSQADIDETLASEQIESEFRNTIIRAVALQQQKATVVPVILSISNIGSSGIRNLYVEMLIQAITGEIEIMDTYPSDPTVSRYYSSQLYLNMLSHASWESAEENELERKLDGLSNEKLTHGDEGWKYSFEWNAIQPQRIRIVKPRTFIWARSTAQVEFTGKVYADSFAEPLLLKAKMTVDVQTKKTALGMLLNLDKLRKAKATKEQIASFTWIDSSSPGNRSMSPSAKKKR